MNNVYPVLNSSIELTIVLIQVKPTVSRLQYICMICFITIYEMDEFIYLRHQ